MDKYKELIECGNGAIVDMAMKCEAVFSIHKKALVSVSGGADSDVMLDLCERVRTICPIDITYVFFDTGIEYAATKRHIDYLERRYGTTIKRCRAEKTIPVCCKEYGRPFLNKFISECMSRLQKHGFRWEDKPLDVLLNKYPRCKSALKWWCNGYTRTDEPGYYDIGSRQYLKDFIISHPPTFKISNKCCTYAKKNVAKKLLKSGEYDLNVIGLRKDEGGVRAKMKDARCFRAGETDTYYPLFWLSDSDKASYRNAFNLRHSDCYGLWGFKRTGCVGCPFSRNLERDMETTKKFEPLVHKAASKVFADSYEYTRAYRTYRIVKTAEEVHNQLVLPICI